MDQHVFRGSIFRMFKKGIKMTPDTRRLAIQMASVWAACNKAPAGPKRSKAMKHYLLAEKAQVEEDHTLIYRELDAARQALV